MSKKNRRREMEIPQVGNALEVPNYVTPTTDLGCGPEREHAPVDTRLEDCRGRSGDREL